MYIFYMSLIGSFAFLLVSRLVFEIVVSDEEDSSEYMLLFVLDHNESNNGAFHSLSLQKATYEQYSPDKVLNIENSLNNIIQKITEKRVNFFRNGDTKLGVVMNLQLQNLQDLMNYKKYQNSTDLERGLIMLNFFSEMNRKKDINFNLETKDNNKALSRFKFDHHPDIFEHECTFYGHSAKHMQADGNSSKISPKQIMNSTKDVRIQITRNPANISVKHNNMNSITTVLNKAHLRHNLDVDKIEDVNLKVLLFKSVGSTNESQVEILNNPSHPILSTSPLLKMNIQNLKHNVSLMSLLNFAKLKVITKTANIRKLLLGTSNENSQHASYYSWKSIRNFVSDTIEAAMNRLIEQIHSMRYYQAWLHRGTEGNYWHLIGEYLNSYFTTLRDILINGLDTYHLHTLCLLSFAVTVLCYRKFARKTKVLENELYQNIANFENLNRHLYTLRKDLTKILNINEMALEKCKQGVDLQFKMSEINLDIFKRVSNVVGRLNVDTGDDTVGDFQKMDLINQSKSNLQLIFNSPQWNRSVQRNSRAESSSLERTPRRATIRCNHSQQPVKPKQKPLTKWTNQISKGNDRL